MTRWPRRARPIPPDLPKPLAEFAEADWSEWLLDGPDPGAEPYVDREAFYALPHQVTRACGWANGKPLVATFMVGIGDRPQLVAFYRRLDAHRRWREARRAWLEAHGHHALALDSWIDAVDYEHRVLRAELREART